MPRYDRDGEIWRFETAHFVVTCNAEEEWDDPEGHFGFEEDIEFARQGGAAWFAASVHVWLKPDPAAPCYAGDPPGEELGSAHLGGCSYHSFAEFVGGRTGWKRGAKVSGRDYFGDMVREAINEARRALARTRKVADAMRLAA